jgi:hypothetical protein
VLAGGRAEGISSGYCLRWISHGFVVEMQRKTMKICYVHDCAWVLPAGHGPRMHMMKSHGPWISEVHSSSDVVQQYVRFLLESTKKQEGIHD